METKTIAKTTTKLTARPRNGSRDATKAPRPMKTMKTIRLARFENGRDDRSFDSISIAAEETVIPSRA